MDPDCWYVQNHVKPEFGAWAVQRFGLVSARGKALLSIRHDGFGKIDELARGSTQLP